MSPEAAELIKRMREDMGNPNKNNPYYKSRYHYLQEVSAKIKFIIKQEKMKYYKPDEKIPPFKTKLILWTDLTTWGVGYLKSIIADGCIFHDETDPDSEFQAIAWGVPVFKEK